MDVESRSLRNFILSSVSIFWDFRTKPGGVDFCLLPTSWLTLSPQDGEVPKVPIRTSEEGSSTLTSLWMSPGVLPSTPILLTYPGLLLIHVLPDTISATTFFVAVGKSVCGSNIMGTIPCSIPGFIGRGKTGIFR